MSIQLQKLRISKMIHDDHQKLVFGKLMNSYRTWGLEYMLIIWMTLKN